MRRNILFVIAFLYAVWVEAAVLPPSADSTTTAGVAIPKGGAITLQVGGKNRSWVQFDLGQLPAGTTGAQVARAVLRLYPSTILKDSAISISAVAGSWNEGTVVHSTAPATESPAFIAVPVLRAAKRS